MQDFQTILKFIFSNFLFFFFLTSDLSAYLTSSGRGEGSRGSGRSVDADLRRGYLHDLGFGDEVHCGRGSRSENLRGEQDIYALVGFRSVKLSVGKTNWCRRSGIRGPLLGCWLLAVAGSGFTVKPVGF